MIVSLVSVFSWSFKNAHCRTLEFSKNGVCIIFVVKIVCSFAGDFFCSLTPRLCQCFQRFWSFKNVLIRILDFNGMGLC